MIMQNILRYHLPAFLVVVLTCLSSTSARAAQAAKSRPNVILIITDDQGYGDIAFHGNTMIQTPALDKLAKQSLRLTNFHVDPTCAETRSALMSGKYPLRVGVWHTIMGRSIMRPDVVTMPQMFRESGYRTGMFGKWHLGDNHPYRPHERGFDETLHCGGGGVGQTPDVWGNDYVDDVYYSNGQLSPQRGYCTDVFFEAAKKFIAQESDKPFFCYLATNAPHGPYTVDESYKKPYLEKGVAEPMASFYGMIANIDENISKLNEFLDAKRLSRDTLVVFMTDNGTAAGFQNGRRQARNAQDTEDAAQGWMGFNAGMRGTKGQQYEGGHRVPCFIRFPDGKFADKEYSSLSAHVDLLPTLADICGVDVGKAKKLDGVNLMPLVRENKVNANRRLVVQSHRVERPQQWTKSVVMTDQWRLVDGKELYDIQKDPSQTSDLAAENSDIVKQLREHYEAWWKDCNPQPDTYSRIVLGAKSAELVQLTGHDWHGPNPPWSQKTIAKAEPANGFWAVQVQRAGTYQFLLARRPLEDPVAIDCSKVRVQLGDQITEVEISSDVRLAPVTMQLKPGDYELRTQLINNSRPKEDCGAFIVYVNYCGQSEPKGATLPKWLLKGDRVAWLGGTLVERLQGFGNLEAEIVGRAPLAGLTFCNLGWSGDDASGRARAVFGAPQEGKARRLRDLDLAAPSLVIVAYGMSEALDETYNPATFQSELKELVQAQLSAQRRVVLCRIPEIAGASVKSPIPWPQVIQQYQQRRTILNDIINKVADEKLSVIDLPSLKTDWFDSALCVSPAGYQLWCQAFAQSLFSDNNSLDASKSEQLSAISARASHGFFELHRPQNETYLFLFRKHEQGNNAVEPGQNRPLIAHWQLELLQAASRQSSP